MRLFEIPPEVCKTLLHESGSPVAPASPFAFLLKGDSLAPLDSHKAWLQERGWLQADGLMPALQRALEIVAQPRQRITVTDATPQGFQRAVYVSDGHDAVVAMFTKDHCIVSEPVSRNTLIQDLHEKLAGTSPAYEEPAPLQLRLDVMRVLGVLLKNETLIRFSDADEKLAALFENPMLARQVVNALVEDEILEPQGDELAVHPAFHRYHRAITSNARFEVRVLDLPGGEIPSDPSPRRLFFLGPQGERVLLTPLDGEGEMVGLVGSSPEELKRLVGQTLDFEEPRAALEGARQHHRRAQASWQANRIAEALLAFKQATDLAPDFADPYYDQARMLETMGSDSEEIRKLYRRFIELVSENPSYGQQVADAQERMRRLSERRDVTQRPHPVEAVRPSVTHPPTQPLSADAVTAPPRSTPRRRRWIWFAGAVLVVLCLATSIFVLYDQLGDFSSSVSNTFNQSPVFATSMPAGSAATPTALAHAATSVASTTALPMSNEGTAAPTVESATDLLPSMDLIPAGLTLAQASSISNALAAQRYGDTDNWIQIFEDLGRNTGSAHIYYPAPSEGCHAPDGITELLLEVSIFDFDDGAREAFYIDYEFTADDSDTWDIDFIEIGEEAYSATGMHYSAPPGCEPREGYSARIAFKRASAVGVVQIRTTPESDLDDIQAICFELAAVFEELIRSKLGS
jgi:tetratricopeptide (TPR) repeat protein